MISENKILNDLCDDLRYKARLLDETCWYNKSLTNAERYTDAKEIISVIRKRLSDIETILNEEVSNAD